MRGLEHEREFQQQTAELARSKEKVRELARELALARDMLAAIADVAALPLPGRDGWEAFDRENRTRLVSIRGAAKLGCVGQMPAIMAAEIAALKGIAADGLGYEPTPAAQPKPPAAAAVDDEAAVTAEGGGVLVPKFTPHPPGSVSSTSGVSLRLCDCPERDGRIFHDRETCTDPLVAKLDWFAPSPPRPLSAAAVDELAAERRAELATVGEPAAAADVDEPFNTHGFGTPYAEPAAAAVDEPADDADVVDEPARCELCGRVPGMPTAPCQRCPDYSPGWTFARAGSTTL